VNKYLIYQIDSFTKDIFKGNPAGVVPYADGLKGQQMQLITRELNNSETAFLFPPNDDSCDAVIRYFSPTTEVPICGHATIAAMYAKAIEENLESSVHRIKTNVGVLPFEIIKTEFDYKIMMTQGKIEFGNILDGANKTKLLSALHITEEDLEANCPIQIVSTGHSKVMIGIENRPLLNHLKPNMFELSELSKEIKCNGYFVFTFDSDNKDVLTYGRMFAPAIGINEDPVTGNANGPLGAYLIHHQIVNHNGKEFSFVARQGEAIGRLGEMVVDVSIVNNEPALVKISGEAVVIFKTEIEL